MTRAAEILNIGIEPTGASEIARRSRGTPRIANRLLKRVRDFAQVMVMGLSLKVLQMMRYNVYILTRRTRSNRSTCVGVYY